jgi:site-specific recombinase XerD
MKRWDSLVDEYLQGCEAAGLSTETIKSRRSELSRWGGWLKRRRPRPALEGVTPELIVEYVRSRSAYHAKASVAAVVSTLRCMGEFLVSKEVWPSNPLRWIRGPKLDPRARLPKRIGKENLLGLWKEAAQSRGEFARHQRLALLSVLYSTGLRRGEIERLDVSGWNRDEGVLTIDGRKSARERRVPVAEGVARVIEAYLPQRHNVLERVGNRQEKALFVTRYGERLKGVKVSQHIHSLARRARVPLVSLHQFRHTCASDLIEAGVSLPEVQDILGHAVIATTMRYLSISDPERRKAMEKHPLEGVLVQPTRKGDGDERSEA